MKRLFVAVLTVACALVSAFAQSTQPSRRTLTVGDVGAYLLALQPKELGVAAPRLVVIAPSLHSSLVSSFDSLAHGWCENPVLLWCNPAHLPVDVTIITGTSTTASWLVPARTGNGLPGSLTPRAAAVWTLKDAPGRGVWLVLTPRLEDEALLIGGVVDGGGASAELIQAPGLASAMYKQLFVDAVISRATRWTP